MNFATLKSVTVPEGKAVKITQGSTVLWQAQPTEDPILNLIDTVGVTTESRLSSSGAVKSNTGTFVTGMITGVQQGDVFRTSGASFNGGGWAGIWCYKSDGSFWTMTYTNLADCPLSNVAWDIVMDEAGNMEITINSEHIASIRLCGIGTGEGVIVTKNQEIG